MKTEIVLPYLSETMEDGTISRWLKLPGDLIAVGDELVEIETDKITTVYQSDTAGRLTEIVVREGETVPSGTVIAIIESSA
jgi:pyruvate/2-oxoglutarate dehydrogenase complex dihydrolipoamide acyltransferase (E2) component